MWPSGGRLRCAVVGMGRIMSLVRAEVDGTQLEDGKFCQRKKPAKELKRASDRPYRWSTLPQL